MPNQSRRPALEIARSLVVTKSKLLPLLSLEEDLKVQIRTYGANAYSIANALETPGGTVTVGEPEVRSFKGRVLTLNQDKAVALGPERLKALLDLGVVVWEDQYTRNAVAKVETKVFG